MYRHHQGRLSASLFLLMALRSGFVAAADPPSVDQPIRTGLSNPNDAAVVIGNEDYAYLPDVPYAARDAQAFNDWLVYSRGVPQDRTQLLVNASHAAITDALTAAATEVGAGGIPLGLLRRPWCRGRQAGRHPGTCARRQERRDRRYNLR